MERGRLKFTLLTSHYMVVTVNGLRLLLLADPPEDELPEHQKVLDVTAPPYSLDRSGAKDGTDVLQKACDDAGALANEAVVMLPPGLYTTTGIRLRSRTQLYLAPGAVLQGRDDAESYPDYPSAPGKTLPPPWSKWMGWSMFASLGGVRWMHAGWRSPGRPSTGRGRDCWRVA